MAFAFFVGMGGDGLCAFLMFTVGAFYLFGIDTIVTGHISCTDGSILRIKTCQPLGAYIAGTFRLECMKYLVFGVSDVCVEVALEIVGFVRSPDGCVYAP